MSDYDRCPTCRKFAWLSTHRCPPVWQVWNEDANEADDPALIRATDAEDAAEQYAERRPRSEVQADLERKLLRMRWQGPRSALRGLDHLKKELLEIAETQSAFERLAHRHSVEYAEMREKLAALEQERDEALQLAEGPSTLKDLAAMAFERGVQLAAAEQAIRAATEAVCAGADVFEAVSNEWYGPTSGDRLSEFLRARFGTAVKALEQIARTDYGHPDIGLMPLRKLAQDALASLCGEREAPHD